MRLYLHLAIDDDGPGLGPFASRVGGRCERRCLERKRPPISHDLHNRHYCLLHDYSLDNIQTEAHDTEHLRGKHAMRAEVIHYRLFTLASTLLLLFPTMASRAQSGHLLSKDDVAGRRPSMEQLFRSAHDLNALAPLADQLVRSAALPEIRTALASTIKSSLVLAETSTRAHKTNYLHESAIVDAYELWCSMSGLPSNTDTASTSDLHAYRLFLSRQMPSLSMRGANGGLSSYITPTEGFYLFSILVAHRQVPRVTMVGAVGSPLERHGPPVSNNSVSTPTLVRVESSLYERDMSSSISTLLRCHNTSQALAKLGLVLDVPLSMK